MRKKLAILAILALVTGLGAPTAFANGDNDDPAWVKIWEDMSEALDDLLDTEDNEP